MKRRTSTIRESAHLRHDLLATVHTLAGAVELLLTTRLTTPQRRYVNVCKHAVEKLIELGVKLPSEANEIAPLRRPAIDELAELDVCYLPKPVTRGSLLETVKNMGGKLRPRVLIADDSLDSCTVLQQYLHGFARVQAVHDGKSAVEACQTGKYDLLVIDLDMPIMDGCSAIRAIRSWEAANGLVQKPIVVLTAHDLALPMAVDEEWNEGPDRQRLGYAYLDSVR